MLRSDWDSQIPASGPGILPFFTRPSPSRSDGWGLGTRLSVPVPREYAPTAVFGNLAILCGHQTKCAHAQKFKSYAAPLNFSVCTHALSTVGDFNFARLTKTAVSIVRYSKCKGAPSMGSCSKQGQLLLHLKTLVFVPVILLFLDS